MPERASRSAPVRILFIGNSYTNRNDLPGMLTKLAASAKPPRVVETDRVIANGMALRAHLNKGAFREPLSRGKWDYVVLQEQSTLPVKSPARMMQSVEEFDAIVRAAGARTALYMTWAKQDAPERQDEITAAYEAAGAKVGAVVVPAGVAWQRVLKGPPVVTLHTDDKSHPTAAGTYLAACAFAAALLGIDPVGLATGVPGVDPKTAALLQRAAAEVAAPRPRSAAKRTGAIARPSR